MVNLLDDYRKAVAHKQFKSAIFWIIWGIVFGVLDVVFSLMTPHVALKVIDLTFAALMFASVIYFINSARFWHRRK